MENFAGDGFLNRDLFLRTAKSPSRVWIIKHPFSDHPMHVEDELLIPGASLPFGDPLHRLVVV